MGPYDFKRILLKVLEAKNLGNCKKNKKDAQHMYVNQKATNNGRWLTLKQLF